MDTWLDSLKSACRKVVHKASKFPGHKIADAVIKLNDDKIVKKEPVEELVIPLEKIGELLSKLRKVL